jgi:DNA-binding XRE family transcriptional regulator
MRTAIITSKLTGKSVKCHATIEHPDSHYGNEVWVDDQGRAYCDVDKPSEYYDVDEDVENNIKLTIGQRIQELRKEAGMTQAQLAEKCGMAQPNIARIEAGTYATSIDVLSRIAEALGKKIELV